MNMDKRLKKTIKGNVIDWGAFSTEYSLEAILTSEDNATMEQLADRIHEFWICAVNELWFLLSEGYEVKGGYTKEKRASHQTMCVPYAELSRENKLKDCYLIKTLVTHEKWLELGGLAYDYLFEKYDIGW